MVDVSTMTDYDLNLEEQLCSASLPHLEQMIEANRRMLEAVRAEKARRARKAVAA